MAQQQLSSPHELVKKSNDLIRTRITVKTVDASRILAHLIACIRTDDTTLEQVYTVHAKNIIPAAGGRNYKIVKGTCRELISAIAEIEEPDPDGPHPIFIASPFFTKITYKNGIISAIFNPVMRPHLLALRECFTAYNLTEYLALPSLYSQRLFEILKSFANVQSGEMILSLTDLHRFLDTPPSTRANFRELRRRVLEKAHQDITTKTSFRYQWEPVKVGRSVEKIRFIFDGAPKALPQKELNKAKTEKQRRLHTQRIVRATECARAKGGDCRTMDNVRIVCKVCRQEGICALQAQAQAQAQAAAPAPPTPSAPSRQPAHQERNLEKEQQAAQKAKATPLLEAFAAKFREELLPLHRGKWMHLHSLGIAPLASDVPEDNTLDMLAFMNAFERQQTAQAGQVSDGVSFSKQAMKNRLDKMTDMAKQASQDQAN